MNQPEADSNETYKLFIRVKECSCQSQIRSSLRGVDQAHAVCSFHHMSSVGAAVGCSVPLCEIFE